MKGLQSDPPSLLLLSHVHPETGLGGFTAATGSADCNTQKRDQSMNKEGDNKDQWDKESGT